MFYDRSDASELLRRHVSLNTFVPPLQQKGGSISSQISCFIYVRNILIFELSLIGKYNLQKIDIIYHLKGPLLNSGNMIKAFGRTSKFSG